MVFDAILAAAIAVLFVLALIKAVAPSAYDKYVLRDAARPAPSRSSRAVALVILAVLALLAVRFGLDLLHGSQHKSVSDSATPFATEAHVQAWIGLLCVSATGIVLCLYPVAVIGGLTRRRVLLAPGDEETSRKIKALGRALGVAFLVGAVLIARQLL